MVGIHLRTSEGPVLTKVGCIALLGNLLERRTDFRTSFTTGSSYQEHPRIGSKVQAIGQIGTSASAARRG